MDDRMLKGLLEKLIRWNALELCEDEKRNCVCIPYVMNDAAECYLCLHDCRVQGTLEMDDGENMTVTMVSEENIRGMILRQNSGNIVTLWYSEAEWIQNCYQYHMIGHSWRKTVGEEGIRRLVNLVCVLHDKKTYLGANGCNETELFIADLAEFAPVIWFTPINESILDWYEQSENGIRTAMKVAEQAGEHDLTEQISRYERAFFKGKMKEKQIRKMADCLLQPEHSRFWRELEKMIVRASLEWPVRIYDAELEGKIIAARKMLMDRYLALGYGGEYPRIRRENGPETMPQEICFFEQQAFTVMEENAFLYRIFSMSRDTEKYGGTWKEETAFTIK